MRISKADSGILLIAFAEKISQTRITHYSYAPVGIGWEEEVISSLDPDFAKELKLKIDGSLEGLFQRLVFDRFFTNDNLVPEKGADNASLSSYKGFQNPLDVARDFVAKIRKIPQNYVLYTQVSDCIASFLDRSNGEIKISSRMAIAKGSDIKSIAHSSHDIPSYDRYLNRQLYTDDAKFILDESKWYFKFRCSGNFINTDTPTIVVDMLDEMKAFYGSVIAQGYLYKTYRPVKSTSKSILANVFDDDGHQLIAGIAPIDDDLRSCNALSAQSKVKDRFESGETFESIFALPLSLMGSKDGQKLKTASIWLLRAFLSERGMDRILSSAISMEVMLGDRETSDRIGLSKLMANRCAYALGESASDRNAIIATFLGWYKVRSEIVHSGRIRISPEESAIASEGRKLSYRLLNHEIKMLSVETK